MALKTIATNIDEQSCKAQGGDLIHFVESVKNPDGSESKREIRAECVKEICSDDQFGDAALAHTVIDRFADANRLTDDECAKLGITSERRNILHTFYGNPSSSGLLDEKGATELECAGFSKAFVAVLRGKNGTVATEVLAKFLVKRITDKGYFSGPNEEQRATMARELATILPSIDSSVVAKDVLDEADRLDGKTFGSLADLLHFFPKASTPILAKALGHKDVYNVKNPALRVLDSYPIRDPILLDPLTKLLFSSDQYDRIASADILAKMGSMAAPAIGSLVKKLENEADPNGYSYVHALIYIGPQSLPAVYDKLTKLDDDRTILRERYFSVLQGLDEATPYLIRAVQNGSTRVKEHAAWLLGQRGPAANTAVSVLIEKMAMTEPENVSASCMEALSHMGAPAVPALIGGLDHDDLRIRKGCATALGAIGAYGIEEAAQAIDPLKARLKSLHDDERAVCAVALGKIGTAAVPTLIAGLTDADNRVRFASATALKVAGTKASPAVQSLINSLNDPEKEVRQECAYALAAVGQATVSPLVQAFKANPENGEVRRLIAIVLQVTKADAAEAAPVFVEAFGNATDEHLHIYQKALNNENNTGEIAALVDGLSSAQARVRYGSAAGLTWNERLDDHERNGEAVSALMKGLTDPDEKFREACEYTLEQMVKRGNTPAQKALVKGFLGQDQTIGRWCRTKLVQVGPALTGVIVDVVSQAAKDEKAGYFSQALQLLTEIHSSQKCHELYCPSVTDILTQISQSKEEADKEKSGIAAAFLEKLFPQRISKR